ncbi:MAG: hypothetical protein J6V18_07655, partial [Bacteroidales bacterium]|nr:hypothetical protein [Bacteroidales bacterium]
MKKVFVLALSLFALCGVAFAQEQEDVTFENEQGSLSGSYSGNVIINGGFVSVDGNSVASIAGDVIINNGGTFTIYGELTIEGTIYADGGSIISYTDADLGDVVLNGGMLACFDFWGYNCITTIDNLTIEQSASTPQISGDFIINESINVEGYIENLSCPVTLGEYCEINAAPDVVITGWTRKEFSLQPGWNFVGFPHVENISPLAQDDMPILWAYRFDYNANAWGTTFLHWNDEQKDLLAKGNGIFVWSDQAVTTSLIGPSANEAMTINYTGNVDDNQPNWLALANPYFEVLDIASIVGQKYGNGNNATPRCQGECVYKWNGNTFVTAQTGTINTFEGFFVNVAKS